MRIAKFIFCFVGAAVMLVAAWLMPAYLRAVDAEVLKLAGTQSQSLVDRGVAFLELEQSGPADMLSKTASELGVPRADYLAKQLAGYEAGHPVLARRGGSDPYLEQILTREGSLDLSYATNALLTFLPHDSRAVLLNALSGTRRSGLLQILKNRQIQKTVHLPPVSSAAGQPLDAAILMTGLLHQSDHLSSPLRREIENAATLANTGPDTQPIELYYLDLLSLARRLDWVQLTVLMERLDSLQEVAHVVDLVHRSGDDLPALYSALLFAKSPTEVVRYLQQLGIGSLPDLEYAMAQGSRAYELLLQRQVPVERVPKREILTAHPPFDALFFGFVGMTSRVPTAGIYFKYLFVFLGGLLIVMGVSSLFPRPTELEQSLQLKHFGLARQSVIAVVLFLGIIAASEPHLMDTRQPDVPLPRWKFPMAQSPTIAKITKPLKSIMNQLTYASLIGFLVIQGIIYVVCLLRLAEIRKQPISSDLKLKLIDNEESLFDSGLYVGLGGTVVSLVFLALGIVKPSLMAAYSSTMFGILFVAILKIGHVRPLRRRLILEIEFQG